MPESDSPFAFLPSFLYSSVTFSAFVARRYELEKLSTVGTVSVSAAKYAAANYSVALGKKPDWVGAAEAKSQCSRVVRLTHSSFPSRIPLCAPLWPYQVGACAWEVTFETNTGRPETNGQLEQLQVAVIMNDGSIGPFNSEVGRVVVCVCRCPA